MSKKYTHFHGQCSAILKKMNIRNLLSPLRAKKPSIIEEIEIPIGPIRVHVQGEAWRSRTANKVVLNKPVKFSLTPKNDYQLKNKWPEGEFYNVNTYPSIETTQYNWAGYVSYVGKPTAAKIAELVASGASVSVWGFFELEDNELNVVLTLPRTLS